MAHIQEGYLKSKHFNFRSYHLSQSIQILRTTVKSRPFQSRGHLQDVYQSVSLVTSAFNHFYPWTNDRYLTVGCQNKSIWSPFSWIPSWSYSHAFFRGTLPIKFPTGRFIMPSSWNLGSQGVRTISVLKEIPSPLMTLSLAQRMRSPITHSESRGGSKKCFHRSRIPFSVERLLPNSK